MVDLDDAQLVSQLDSQGMLKAVHEMPRQCQQAWQMAMDFDLPQDYSEVNKVVIAGMGGSAIGGSLISTLVVPEAKLPIFVHRDYDLPAFVDAQTLFIASSYSGMTEETLSSFRQAQEAGAKRLAITTIGKLKTLAEKGNVPVFGYDYKGQPRAALAYSFLPMIGFLQKLGILSDKSAEVAETIQVLQQLSQRIDEGVVLSRNPAKQLAQRLYGCLPVIYGAGILSEVAHRWKTQFNENSKTWAFYEIFPELNHNAVVGYQFPQELARKIVVVLLRSAHLSERLELRYRVTCQLLDQAGVDYRFVDGEGASPLSQMMSLVLFGDYTSCYLAILNKVDPTPAKAIDYLKEQLAQTKRE